MGTSISDFLRDNSRLSPTSDDQPERRKKSLMDGILSSPDEQDARLNAITNASQERDPARSARVLQLQSKTGLDTNLIGNNLDDVETRVWKQDFAPAQAAHGPILRDWLAQDPHHIAAAANDLPRLNYLERYTKNIKDQLEAGLNTVRMTYLGEKDFMGTITPRESEELAYLSKQQSPDPDQYELGGVLDNAPLGLGAVAKFIAGIPAATANQLPIQLQTTVAGGVKGAAIGAAVGATAGLLGGPFAEVTVPGGTVAGAKLGAWVGAGIEAAKMEAFTAYPDYKNLKDENGNPLNPLITKTAALLYGAAAGVVEMWELEGLTKTVPGLKSLGRNQVKSALKSPTFRRFLMGVGKDLAGTAAWEGGTEGIQQLLQNGFGVLSQMVQDGNLDQLSTPDLMQRMWAGVGQSIMMGAQGGVGMAGAAHIIAAPGEVLNVQRARKAQRFYEALGDATKGSDLAAQLPDKLRDIVHAMTKDGPLKTVHAPLETWNQYWQSQNVDPARMAEAVTGSPEAYNAAVASGSDIEIPTSSYAATIAPTEHNAFFSQELRHAPDAMNGREMKATVKAMSEASASGEVVTSAGRAWGGFRLRNTDEFKPEDLAPHRTADGDYVFYHGTSQDAAEEIKKTGVLKADDLGSIGVGTDPGAVQAYAGMKAKSGGGGAILEITVPKEVVEAAGANDRIIREIGGSGRNAFLFDPERGNTEPFTLPLKGVRVFDDPIQARARMQAPDPIEQHTQATMNRLAGELAATGIYPDAESASMAVKTIYEAPFRALARRGDVPIDILKDTFSDLSLQRVVNAVASTRNRLADSMRTEGGTLRKAHNVTDEALLNELDALDARTENATRSAVYRNVEVQTSGTDATNKIAMPTFAPGQKGGPSLQAKALHNLVAFERIRQRIHEELAARGYSDEQIAQMRIDHQESKAMIAAERDPEALSATDEEDLPEWARGMADEVTFDPAEFADEGADVSAAAGEYEQSAWHGSPFKFNKFDLTKIGTGEGGQAYGWGLYFAGNKAVAEFYREQLAPQAELKEWRIGNFDLWKDGKYTDYSPHAAGIHPAVASFIENMLIAEQEIRSTHLAQKAGTAGGLGSQYSDVEQYVRATLEEAIIDAEDEDYTDGVVALKKFRDEVKAHGVKFSVSKDEGALYHVEIPDDDTMLDWDKPLGGQSAKVQAMLAQLSSDEALQRAEQEYRSAEGAYDILNPKRDIAQASTDAFTAWQGLISLREQAAKGTATGEHLYYALSGLIGPERASRTLADAGINGIRYMDEGSRHKDPAQDALTYNYVIFDDKLIEIKDLYQAEIGARMSVLHNLSAASLMYADKFGGLAVPSLGVLPAGMAYPGMGNITLIGREAIGDPTKVPIHDSDVWSPTFPKPEFKKAPVKKRDALMKFLRPFMERMRDIGDEYEIEQHLSNGRAADAVAKMLRSPGAMAAYLKETHGIDAEPIVNPKYQPFGFVNTEAWKRFTDENGEFSWQKNEGDEDYQKKVVQAVRASVAEQFADVESVHVRDALIDSTLKLAINDEGRVPLGPADRIGQSIRAIGETSVDHWGTVEKFESMLDKKAFAKWVEDKVMPMHGQPLVKIGRKLEPFTLENVVQVMSGNIRAQQEHMTFGDGKARAAAAHRIRSLTELRNRAAWQISDRATVDAEREKAKATISAWRDEVTRYYKWSDTWDALDNSMRALAQFGKGTKDASSLASALRRFDFQNVPLDVLQRGVEAGLALLEAPVPYFEAKPQRAVGLTEFAGAVIPEEEATPELMAVLEKHGIKASTYDGTEEGRGAAVAALQKELQDAGERVLYQSAWHGSPHKHEQFDISKVGTGEGNSSFGWGLYFAGKRSVAEYYRDALSDTGHEFDALTMDENKDIGDYWGKRIVSAVELESQQPADRPARMVAEAITASAQSIADDEAKLKSGAMQPWLLEERIALHKRSIAALEKLRDSGVYTYTKPGRLFHVDIPEDGQYLMFDLPLTEQPEAVKEAIRKTGYGSLIGTLKYPTQRQASKLLYGTTAQQLEREDIGIRHSIEEGRNLFANWVRTSKDVADYLRSADEAAWKSWWAKKGGRLLNSKLHTTMTGEAFYEEMTRQRGIAERGSYPNMTAMKKAASLFLREHGIAGIKYLNGVSRARGEGDYNYVLFDDRQISIREYFQSPAPNDMSWPTLLSDVPFAAYSALEKAIADAPFEKGTPQQWRAQLKKGVTQNERVTVGIDEFLQEHEKANTKTLTRAEVQAFANDHRMRLGEDVVGDVARSDAERAVAEAFRVLEDKRTALDAYLNGQGVTPDEREWFYNRVSNSVSPGFTDAKARENVIYDIDSQKWGTDFRMSFYSSIDDPPMRDFLAALRRKQQAESELFHVVHNRSAAYESYTLPGGSNYREVALTLPVARLKHTPGTLPPGAYVEERGPGDWLAMASRNGGAVIGVGATRQEAIDDITNNLVDDDFDEAVSLGDAAVFRSRHAMPPNTLVHIRLKDRIGKYGERILFVEEIQSDWHQQGRKWGYRVALTAAERSELNALVSRLDKTSAESARVEELLQKDDAAQRASMHAPPDAPFKKTGEWVELALKRVLAEAVRGNYDAIAWTTGQQQADRYRLSQVVDDLYYSPDTHTLAGIQDGSNVYEETVSPEDLPLHIGEAAAAALLARPANETMSGERIQHLNLSESQEIHSSEAIGMTKFYEGILPATLNKLLKRIDIDQEAGTITMPLTTDVSEESWDVMNDEFPEPSDVEQPGINVGQALRDAVEKGVPLFHGTGDSPRGRIRISSLGKMSIEFFEKADLSTFIHETGHFYTELLHRLAPHSPSVAADLAVLRNWVRADEGKALTVDQHEQIARGFESYIMEGKAPTHELQGAFSRMKAWMLLVYRNIKALKVKLTPEVSDVFDRLFAAQDEIENAQATAPALFANAMEFMTDADRETYGKAVEEAHTTAQLSLEQKLLADVKREYTKAWKDARARIRGEIAQDVNADPMWRALSILQRGTLPDGTPLPEGLSPIKLDRADIVERYGERQLVLLPKPYIYSSEGGITVDAAAELLGFQSGDALIKAMPQPGGETPRAHIERLTNERMQQEFGDKLLDGKTAEEAIASVHNEDRARLLRMELQYLAENKLGALKGLVRKVASRHLPVVETVRAEAEAIINAKKHVDINPNTYLVAERKAAGAALKALLAGDMQRAFDEKNRELFNHELYRAAVAAKEQAEKDRKYLTRFTDDKTRAKIGKAGHNYLDQIDGLLDRVDFAPASKAALERRQSLLQFSQEHPEVDIPESLLHEANRINWRDMTVSELADLRNTVTQIAHLAKTKNQLLKSKAFRDLSEAAAAFTGAIEAHSNGARAKEIETRLPQSSFRRSIEAWFASHQKLASLVRIMDGFVEGGPVTQLVLRPLNEAADVEAEENARASQWLFHAFSVFNDEKRSLYTKEKIEGTDISLSKMGRLMVALNWGNEVNRQRLLSGYGWTEKTVQPILDSLENKDWDFVEGIWSNIDSYWPRLEELGQKLTGLKPVKVDAAPFTTRAGREIRGGYFPIAYDDRQNQAAYEHRAEDMAERVKRGAAVRSTTEKGMLKERVKGAVHAEVRLDFGVIFQHVSEVVHTITHTEALMDVSKVLRHGDVMAAIKAHYGDIAFKEMTRLLDDIAAGNVGATEGFEDKLAWLREGATLVGLGFNVTTMMLQPFGLANSAARIGAPWVSKGLSRWISDPRRMTDVVAMVHEKSLMMKHRHATMMREIAEVKNDIGFSSSGPLGNWIDEALEKVSGDKLTRAAIKDSFLWGIGKMQMVADIPTWLGAYEKAMADPEVSAMENPDAEAVARADQAVKDSQGGGQTVDLARVQRGGPLLKVWTTFYSYFNMVYQQLNESRIQHGKLNPVELGRLAVDFMLLVTVPSALGMLVRDTFGGGDDKKKDEYWMRLAREQASYLLGTMLFAREVSSFATGYTGYSGPAGGRVFGELGKLVQQTKQGELDGAFWKSLNKSAGIFLHYPAVAVERFVTGVAALEQGRSSNPLDLIFGHKGK